MAVTVPTENLTQLKVHSLTGPAQYSARPCVWIHIQDTQDTFDKHGGLVARFNRWSIENRVYTTISAGHSGGGSYMGAYDPQDAERITQWLKEQGALETDLT